MFRLYIKDRLPVDALLHRDRAVAGPLRADRVEGLQMPVISFGNARPLQIRYASRGVMALIVGAILMAATACGASGSHYATAPPPHATSSSQHGSMPIPASPADVAAAGISISNFK